MDAVTSRLEASIKAMREYFPEFSLSGSPIGTGPVAVWKGKMQPLRSAEHLEEILDDIYRGSPVLMCAGGVIAHRPDCPAEHSRHDWLEKVIDPLIEYKLEVRYGGGEAHPTAYVRDPVVPLFKRRKHHFEDGSLCAYPAWFDIWRWDRDTVVEFMAHATEWLVKWTVWDQAGVWLGPEKDHYPGLLLQEIRPDQQCHCRSGRAYGLCHRAKDEAYVMGNVGEAIKSLSRN